MSLSERHFGRIAEVEGNDVATVDIGTLVRRLILFEQVIVESVRLQEFPDLVRALGVGGIRELVASGAMRVICDAQTAGQIGQATGLRATEARGGPLPRMSFRVESMTMADRDWYVDHVFGQLEARGMSGPEAGEIRGFLEPVLETYPAASGRAGIVDANVDMREANPILWHAIRQTAEAQAGIDPGPVPDMRVEELANGDEFHIDTSLGRLGIDAETEHKLVERSVLAVAGLNQRVHTMAELQAVTGFRDDEGGLFQKRLSVLSYSYDANHHERRFERFVSIAGLPSLSELPDGAPISADRLLALRDDPDIVAFRRWLRGIDRETDDEVADATGGLREKLAWLSGTAPGRATRFLVATAPGFVPVVGQIVGPVLSGADSFLLGRVLGKPGPATFFGRRYASIFPSETGPLGSG